MRPIAALVAATAALALRAATTTAAESLRTKMNTPRTAGKVPTSADVAVSATRGSRCSGCSRQPLTVRRGTTVISGELFDDLVELVLENNTSTKQTTVPIPLKPVTRIGGGIRFYVVP